MKDAAIDPVRAPVEAFPPVDWARVRRGARRRAMRRAALLAAMLPPLVVVAIVELADEVGGLGGLSQWLTYLLGIGVLGLAAMMVGDLRGVLRGDPLVLRTDVLERSEALPGNARLAALAVHRLLGLELLVDVGAALRLDGRGGAREDAAQLGCRRIGALSGVHRRVQPGSDVFLVCAPNGRAVGLLSELV